MKKWLSVILALVLLLTGLPMDIFATGVASVCTPEISAEITTDAVKIVWSAVDHAQGYQIMRKTGNGEWVFLGDVSSTSYKDRTADSGMTVSYTVRAYAHTEEGTVYSENADAVDVFFVAATLSNVAKGVSIEWTAVEDASYYRVSRRVPGGSWNTICDQTTENYYTDTEAESGTKYQYAVQALRNGALTDYQYDLDFIRLEQPDIKVSNKTGGVKITWNQVPGATHYNVYRKVSGGSWKLLSSETGTSYQDSTAKSGTTYSYRVRANYGDVLSSNKKTESILRLSTPRGKVSNVYTGLSVKWNAVEGAESYRVYRQEDDGSWKLLKKGIKEAKYVDTTVKSGKTYSYYVRAFGDGVLSGYVYTDDFLHLSRPVVSAKTVATDKVEVSWEPVKGAQKYYVFLESEDGNSQAVFTVRKTSYTAELKFGESWKFSVRAASGDTESSKSKSVTGKATYPAPNYSVELKAGKGIRICWDEVEGAGSYRVYRRTKGGSWKTLKTTTSTSYVDTSGQAGATYEYAVRAYELKNAKGVSGIRATGKTAVYSKVDPKKPMVALTFDDGPSKYTPDILDALEKHGAHATFFVVGQRVSSYSKTIKRAYDLGCEIGNHSWSHPQLSAISVKEMKKELSKTDEAIEKIIGKKPDLLRPPYGAVDDDVKKYAGKPLIHWSIDTRDWEHRSSSKTISSVMNNVRDGSIVLMHDIYAATRTAAVSLIPKLIDKGYQLVTVSELAAYRGIDLKDGKIYYSIRK